MDTRASEAIFGWNSPSRTPEYGKPVKREKLYRDDCVELACQLQDLAITVDEDGEETWEDEQSVSINALEPLAKVLLTAVRNDSDRLKSDAIKNLANGLEKWLNNPPTKGRAYQIKAYAFQLAAEIMNPKMEHRLVDDDIPF